MSSNRRAVIASQVEELRRRITICEAANHPRGCECLGLEIQVLELEKEAFNLLPRLEKPAMGYDGKPGDPRRWAERLRGQ